MADIQLCILSDSELKGFDPSQYLKEYSWNIFTPRRPVIDFIVALTDGGSYDVYFNLCDGADDPQVDYDGIAIVRALEELQLPFTGANSRFYDPSREAKGIGFARGMNVTSVDESNFEHDL